MATSTPAVMDSLAPSAPGQWSFGHVTVERVKSGPLVLSRNGDGLLVRHSLTAADLSERLVAGVTASIEDADFGQDEFELTMVGLVRSTVDGALEAWTTYYRNSLNELLDGSADFAPIHEKAQEWVRGSVLDLGSCFGFFPLRLAKAGMSVTATDIHPGTMILLDAVAPELGIDIKTLICDAGEVPAPDKSVDTVTAIHLLEHVDDTVGEKVIAQALRIARQRVVIAVPFEDEATACHGHIRTFDLESLRVVGEKTGAPFEVFEHHGGWLVLDAQ
ncbi:mycofactocin oligosaccharide methyltransferase MftM [Rhodococcus sp. IEGM 1379]|uniref:mycofactocin oligosaccharide methyltransferase MftM n=1 Tax=Rhodococcus sp. IEGM 1379 TaxID=3047086 RepID=UPI0024B6E622|nr:mycofactocin oligosaccharide methyltransferase MftM [Rhodococcus sp. IEGM 1379]MDI9916383.1 mycofactocin oligosaccharide methyltransferase MftM [Rhodococcus sp. IEGM 1379]